MADKRYQALYLFLSGKACEQVAETVDITKTTASNIHIVYKNEGLKEKAILKAVILYKVPSEAGFQQNLTGQQDLSVNI